MISGIRSEISTAEIKTWENTATSSYWYCTLTTDMEIRKSQEGDENQIGTNADKIVTQDQTAKLVKIGVYHKHVETSQ